MFMNVAQMLSDRRALLDWGNAKLWNFMMYDQGMLESFYRQGARVDELTKQNKTIEKHHKGWHAWDSFDDNKYNARGFMKLPGVQPFVWHWHDFKPYDVACWLGLLEQSKWNLTISMREGLLHGVGRRRRGVGGNDLGHGGSALRFVAITLAQSCNSCASATRLRAALRTCHARRRARAAIWIIDAFSRST